ncbi:hypothetical protein EniLVp02_0013 [Vibrio phage EniLVp02]
MHFLKIDRYGDPIRVNSIDRYHVFAVAREHVLDSGTVFTVHTPDGTIETWYYSKQTGFNQLCKSLSAL